MSVNVGYTFLSSELVNIVMAGGQVCEHDLRRLATAYYRELRRGAQIVNQLQDHGWKVELTLETLGLSCSHDCVQTEDDAVEYLQDAGLDPDEFDIEGLGDAQEVEAVDDEVCCHVAADSASASPNDPLCN